MRLFVLSSLSLQRSFLSLGLQFRVDSGTVRSSQRKKPLQPRRGLVVLTLLLTSSRQAFRQTKTSEAAAAAAAAARLEWRRGPASCDPAASAARADKTPFFLFSQSVQSTGPLVRPSTYSCDFLLFLTSSHLPFLNCMVKHLSISHGDKSRQQAGESNCGLIWNCGTDAVCRQLTREYQSIQANPPPYIVAHPSESNILE